MLSVDQQGTDGKSGSLGTIVAGQARDDEVLN